MKSYLETEQINNITDLENCKIKLDGLLACKNGHIQHLISQNGHKLFWSVKVDIYSNGHMQQWSVNMDTGCIVNKVFYHIKQCTQFYGLALSESCVKLFLKKGSQPTDPGV